MADRASKIQLTDSNDLEINPATEEKQDDIISALWWSSTLDLLLDDTTTANNTYIWEATIWSATSSAVWRIKKLDETSWLLLWWADSDANFDNIWDDRASLSYSQ